jgi:anti-repressor protein
MQELIKLENMIIGGDDTLMVDARSLWESLGSKQQYSHWIQGRLNNYGFVQDVDFLVDKIIYENNQGFRYDHKLTTDTAKEIAMLENNDIGRKIRRYFIEREKQAVRLSRERLQHQLQLALPKALAYERLEALPGAVTVSEAAKLIGIPVMSLFHWLSSHKWIFRRGSNGKWPAYANKLKQGLLCHGADAFYDKEAEEEKSFVRLYVTPKGAGRLATLVA